MLRWSAERSNTKEGSVGPQVTSRVPKSASADMMTMVIPAGCRQDSLVARCSEADIEDVDRVVSSLAQASRNPWSEVGVDYQPHPGPGRTSSRSLMASAA